MNRRHFLLGAAAAPACAPTGNANPPPPFPIRRGVNLGNALEAPSEGEWGYRIETRHLDAIAEAGFDGVRLPVRWDHRMQADAPYTIDPDHFARVESVVMEALTRNLKVQLDAHHDAPMMETPDAATPRYRALWRQIAERFADAPPELIFEPLNEPRGDVWTGERVTQSQIDALAEIRPSNPTRIVVLGGPNWNSIDGLRHWTPPEDPHIAITAHYYEPFNFTHQGAEFTDPTPVYEGEWGSRGDRAAVTNHIERAAMWARARGHALQIGEFGAIRSAPVAQRAAWTRYVREVCEANGVGWCVWDFAGAFPIYNVDEGRFIPEMLDALLR